MPRHTKVTLEAVARAAKGLRKAGIDHPTVAQVRNVTGGSSKIVSAFMREAGVLAPKGHEKPLPKEEQVSEEGVAPEGPAFHDSGIEMFLNAFRLDLEVLRRELDHVGRAVSKLREELRGRKNPHKEIEYNNKFYGKGVGDAVADVLSEKRQELSPRELGVLLDDAGFPFIRDPTATVANALTKREPRGVDVIRVTRGKWGLRSWYTDAQMDEIRRAINRKPGRDADFHSEKVRQGMESAKARGVKFTKSFDELYSDAAIKKFQRLRAEGATIKAALEAIAMPRSTYMKYRKKMDG